MLASTVLGGTRREMTSSQVSGEKGSAVESAPTSTTLVERGLPT